MNNLELQSKLSDLGLTTEESSVYLLLLAKGSLSAKSIGEELTIIVNSVYRATKALIEKGLVKELDISPKRFQAVPPTVGIKQLAKKQTIALYQLSESLIHHLPAMENPNRLNMELLTGRKELFDSYVKLAKGAKDEILVISIGEEVPESIWTETKAALERGVKPKFIFHKYDKENILLIKRWLAMGVPVSYIPGEGYHLNIFDHTSAILSASNPTQSKERTGVVIYNEAIIEALRSYFFQQLSSAKKL